jgi:hypothetical protein
MAELNSSSVQGTRDLLEMEDNKELRDIGSTGGGSSGDSKSRDDSAVNPDPLAHLQEHFRKEIEAQATVKSRNVSFKVCQVVSRDSDANFQELFRFAGRQEKLLMLSGSIMAIGSGSAMPLMVIIFGSVPENSRR